MQTTTTDVLCAKEDGVKKKKESLSHTNTQTIVCTRFIEGDQGNRNKARRNNSNSSNNNRKAPKKRAKKPLRKTHQPFSDDNNNNMHL